MKHQRESVLSRCGFLGANAMKKLILLMLANDSLRYTDNDHAEDVFPGKGPVRQYVVKGDGRGKDIGYHTGVKVYFNSLQIEIIETGNCRAP
jgi:hypothetical protein